MLAVELHLERGEYLPQEEIEFRVRIANGTGGAVRLRDPELAIAVQPAFRLTGPSFPDGHDFTQRMLSGIETGPDREIEIAAGTDHENTVSLRPLGTLQPGEYRLDATLEIAGSPARTATTTFRIRPMTIASIDLGFGAGDNPAQGLGAFLHRGDPGGMRRRDTIEGADNDRVLFTFAWMEDSPEIDEAMVQPPLQRLLTGADATDVRIPRPNASFFDELLQWVVWREGKTVKGLHTAALEPVAIDLPVPARMLVHSALEPQGGTIEVLALAEDGRELHLVQFAGGAGTETARLAGKTALPAPPQAMTTALSPRDAGGTRHVAAVIQHDDDIEVLHAVWDGNGTFGPFASARTAGRALQNASPAMRVDADGNVRVGVLDLLDDAQCALIEVDFPPSGNPAAPRAHRLGELTDKLLGGGLLYYGDKEWAAVVLLDQNRVLKAAPAQELAPIALPGTPTMPLLLFHGEQQTYLLFVGTDDCLEFQALY
jgi:hypothetical protein